jgi:hypothetical protein
MMEWMKFKIANREKVIQMYDAEMKIKYLREQYDQLGLFINLYQSNATIHAALRVTIQKKLT